MSAPLKLHLAPEDPRDCWRTPWWVVHLLEARLGGRFDLDVAADAENAKAPRFFTRVDNALERPLICELGFCNPPFSLLLEFVTHCLRALRRGEAERGFGFVTLADVSTRYWGALEDAGAHRLRLRGRWSCESPPGVDGSGARMPMAAWTLERPLTVARARRLYAHRVAA